MAVEAGPSSGAGSPDTLGEYAENVRERLQAEIKTTRDEFKELLEGNAELEDRTKRLEGEIDAFDSSTTLDKRQEVYATLTRLRAELQTLTHSKAAPSDATGTTRTASTDKPDEALRVGNLAERLEEVIGAKGFELTDEDVQKILERFPGKTQNTAKEQVRADYDEMSEADKNGVPMAIRRWIGAVTDDEQEVAGEGGEVVKMRTRGTSSGRTLLITEAGAFLQEFAGKGKPPRTEDTPLHHGRSIFNRDTDYNKRFGLGWWHWDKDKEYRYRGRAYRGDFVLDGASPYSGPSDPAPAVVEPVAGADMSEEEKRLAADMAATRRDIDALRRDLTADSGRPVDPVRPAAADATTSDATTDRTDAAHAARVDTAATAARTRAGLDRAAVAAGVTAGVKQRSWLNPLRWMSALGRGIRSIFTREKAVGGEEVRSTVRPSTEIPASLRPKDIEEMRALIGVRESIPRGPEWNRAEYRALREMQGDKWAKAEKLGHAWALHDIAEKWRKLPRWATIGVSLGLLGAGAASSVFAPAMLGLTATAALAWRALSATATGIGVASTVERYLTKRNHKHPLIWGAIAGFASGGFVAFAPRLFADYISGLDSDAAAKGAAGETRPPVPQPDWMDPPTIQGETQVPVPQPDWAEGPSVAGETRQPVVQPDWAERPSVESDAPPPVPQPDWSEPPTATEAIKEATIAPGVDGADAAKGIQAETLAPEVPAKLDVPINNAIADFGIDGLIDSQMNDFLKTFNLSPEAVEQFKDAVRRVLVANPDLAERLGEGIQVSGNDIVFPDDGSVDMRPFGSGEFKNALLDVILTQEKKHLVPGLGARADIFKFVDQLGNRYVS